MSIQEDCQDIFVPKILHKWLSSIIHNSPKKWKQPKCTQQMNGYIHTMEYYLTIKRNGVWLHATMLMNLDNIILSERNQGKDT